MKKLVLLAVMLFGFTAFAQTQEDAQKQAYKKAETLTATHVDRIVSMLEIKDDNTTQKIKEVLFEKNLILSQHPDLSEQRKVILKDKIEGVLNNVLDENQLAKLKKDQDFYGQLLK
jgi:Ni/Co efflux regulator RcnB